LRVERSLTVTAMGELSVAVSPLTPRSYVGRTVNVEINFNDIAVGPFMIDIDWGDGSAPEHHEEYGLPPFTYGHIYHAAGTYTITVHVEDESTGATGTGSATQEIREALSVSFDATPKTGSIPLEVTFTCEAAKGYLPYSWTLDFGDGTSPESGTRTSEGSWTVKHTYTKVGTFTAKLTVTDDLGAEAASLSVKIASTIKEAWNRLSTLKKTLVVASIALAAIGAGALVARRR